MSRLPADFPAFADLMLCFTRGIGLLRVVFAQGRQRIGKTHHAVAAYPIGCRLIGIHCYRFFRDECLPESKRSKTENTGERLESGSMRVGLLFRTTLQTACCAWRYL